MASSSKTPTIIDLKTSFLRSQILGLSTPLKPSQDFLSSNISDEENALRQKAIDEALLKLNTLLKNHNKAAYGPQALRHVAEQVDRLYWNAGERGVNGGALAEGEEWAERGVDFRNERIIEKLPDTWSEEAEEMAPEKAERYKELQRRLAEANEKRSLVRERVAHYKALKELLVPFEEPAENVQGNLVVRDGEIEKELERMKLLLLRVQRACSGLEQKPDADGDAEEMDVDVDLEGERRLFRILGAG